MKVMVMKNELETYDSYFDLFDIPAHEGTFFSVSDHTTKKIPRKTDTLFHLVVGQDN